MTKARRCKICESTVAVRTWCLQCEDSYVREIAKWRPILRKDVAEWAAARARKAERERAKKKRRVRG